MLKAKTLHTLKVVVLSVLAVGVYPRVCTQECVLQKAVLYVVLS